MSIQFKTAADAVQETGLKAVIYGSAGVGKTVFCTTSGDRTMLLSAEAGLLSIRNTKADIAIHEVRTLDDVGAAYEYLKNDTEFKTICIDSISEVAEVCLAEELKKSASGDPRKAYGELIQRMTNLIRAFRDLPGRDVVMTAKVERILDDSNRLLYSPAMPGAKLGAALPYLFDLVCPLRVEKDREGALQRWLQTGTDGSYVAKDRSGLLEMFTEPDLAAIKAQIAGVTSTKKAA
jgi:hypothetical protein